MCCKHAAYDAHVNQKEGAMKRPMLALSLVVLVAPVFASDAVTSFVVVRSDPQGRIQVVVDGDDPHVYEAYLFGPKGRVPTIPGQTYRALVVKSDNRLTVDSTTPPLHLDLYLPSAYEDPVIVGEFPSLRVNGIGLRTFRAPRTFGTPMAIAISMDDVGSMTGVANPALVTCSPAGKATKDSECLAGGPNSLYSPAFKCPGRSANSPILGFTTNAGEIEKQECSAGFYGCGFCTGSPDLVIAHQECRPYDCTPPKKLPPTTPPPDPGP